MMRTPSRNKNGFPSEPHIDVVQLNGISTNALPTKIVKRYNNKPNLRIATTFTLQQYAELRKRQSSFTVAAALLLRRPEPSLIPDTTQYTISPLVYRITSIIEQTLSHNNITGNSTSGSRLQSNKEGKVKRVVRFATDQNVTIRYDIDAGALSKKESDAMFWYTAQEYTRFRTESNEMATYGSGDIDFQQYFLTTLYPYCHHIAGIIISGNKLTYSTIGNNMAMPVSPTESDTDSSISTFSSNSSTGSTAPTDLESCSGSIGSINSSISAIEAMNTTDMDTTELEMISKYRGLERIMFRHILQDLKIDYIKRCVKAESENCYFDIDENDMVLDDDITDKEMDTTSSSSSSSSTIDTSNNSSGNFRHYMYISQTMAQFVGQVDHHVVVLDNQEYFLTQRKLQREQTRKAREEKKKRDGSKSNCKRGKDCQSEGYSYEDFQQQTIEI